MTRMRRFPERTELAPGLNISRIVTGLWQVADMERGGKTLDPDRAARGSLADYARAGFDTFDMADHYGSAEIITGRFLAMVRRGEVATPKGTPPTAFTKWCPEPGPMTRGGRARRNPAQPRSHGARSHRPAAIPLVDVRASRISRCHGGVGAAAGRRARSAISA